MWCYDFITGKQMSDVPRGCHFGVLYGHPTIPHNRFGGQPRDDYEYEAILDAKYDRLIVKWRKKTTNKD